MSEAADALEPPVEPPVEPMLARPAVSSSLDGFADSAFEPKWDGFRCLAFRQANGLILQGRGRSRSPGEVVDLAYAFPELIEPMMDALRPGTVIDSEIVVEVDGRLDFAALSSRLRPRSASAAPSIARLARSLPATVLAFDLLATGRSVMALTFRERRSMLHDLAAGWSRPLRITPSTEDPIEAMDWFHRFEAAGVDGLIVKPLADAYQPGKRAQWKVKHHRTADVVVAGWRPQSAPHGGEVVGSLLLGLYDEQGQLHYVGGASAFTATRRQELVHELAPFAVQHGDVHPWTQPGGNRVPGGETRWGPGKAWRPLAPSLVAEVSYDQPEGQRFRHAAVFMRWRPDRSPDSCGFDQFAVPVPASIDALLGLSRSSLPREA